MRSVIEPSSFPWLDTSAYTFSSGMSVGSHAWFSGQTAGVYDNEVNRVTLAPDPATQARLCWEKVEAVLEGGDLGLDDISHVVEYLTPAGAAAADEIGAERVRRIGEDVPLHRVTVNALARPEAMVEVEVTTGPSEPDAGEVVWLPQIHPVDDDGNVIAPGDIVGQKRACLERAAELLAHYGLDLSHVVRTVDFTTPATRGDYRGTGEPRRELLAPSYPASAGILMAQLSRPDVLITLDVTAARAPKEVLNPGLSAFEQLTFSPGVRAGDLIWLSGATAWDPATGDTGAIGDIGGQAEIVFDQYERILAEAGASLADLVQTVEYVTPDGLADYRSVGEVRRRRLSEPYPAATGVGCQTLLGRDWMIEIEAVAVVGS